MEQDLSLINKFAIDEKYIGRNGYISPVIDQDTNKVIFIAEGKDNSTLTQFDGHLKKHKGNTDILMQYQKVLIVR